MRDKQFLMIPGPTPVPQTALIEMGKAPLGHRSSEFSAIVKETYEDLKWLFQTKNNVFIYTASGTGAMEAALANILNPGDKVLSLVIGNFGERLAKISTTRGADVERMTVDFGQTISPAALKERLDKDVNKEIKVITLTHSETSTGCANPLKDLMAIIKEHGAISVVDGVTSVGAMDVRPDEWGIDILISGSQKGFMVPPGLSFLMASEKAMKAYEECKYPSFYFDFAAHKKNLEKDTTPYTPAVSLICALNATLKMMKEEGLQNIFARHKRLSMGLRKAIRAMGLKLFVDDDTKASYSITSILPPDGISVADIRKGLKENFDIVVADGQNDLKGKIFRMGTLGYVCERDLIGSIGALEVTLKRLGANVELGSGVRAFLESIA